jgi:hypothetical protein
LSVIGVNTIRIAPKEIEQLSDRGKEQTKGLVYNVVV